MAYTIISQNNSTTTLSDGVNTITVPSRVNLTSGNFTIVEVNNNMATLEDGDGNVYRDIPCVATLAGEGGGGGSALPDQTGHSGEFLTTDGTDASWAAVDALPSQTGQSGKFLTTDGTDASWSDKPLVNTATGANSLTLLGTPAQYSGTINIGYNTPQSSGVIIGNNITGNPNSNVLEIGNSISGNVGTGSVVVGKDLYCNMPAAVVIGNYCNGQGIGAIAIGTRCKATANGAIQIGWTQQNAGLTNGDTNTFKVGNNNGNFEMMSADGTIPTARLTKVNTTITLAAADWSSNTQTVSVTGMTATGVVMVSPDPADQSAYTSAGIICSAQAANSLTFTCSTTPSADLSVNVVML